MMVMKCVCTSNYDRMVVFGFSFLKCAVCLWGLGRCLKVLLLTCTPVTDYVAVLTVTAAEISLERMFELLSQCSMRIKLRKQLFFRIF